MSNSRLYGASRFETQGRSANLSATMFKRTPIFTHVNTEKVDSTPFANYKASESFSSQTTQEDRINPESIRLIVKEELNKLPSFQEANRKLILTMQAQLTDLKQRVSEYEKGSNTRIQETIMAAKQDLRSDAERMDKEVEQEITSKLRTVFQKISTELKIDILKAADEQFLTISYGEDLETRLEDINSRIDSLHSFINSKQIPSDELQTKIQKAAFLENIEPKLSKIERQLESNKKNISDINSRVKPIEQWIEQANKRKEIEEFDQKVQSLKQRIKNLDQETQKKIGNFQIQLSNTDGDISILKDKISELKKYNEQQRSLFLDFNKKLSNKGALDDDFSDVNTSILMDSTKIPKKTEKKQAIEPEATPKQAEEVKLLYQFDTDGYLMDGDGQYILKDGLPMQFSQQHIQAAMESNLVKIVE